MVNVEFANTEPKMPSGELEVTKEYDLLLLVPVDELRSDLENQGGLFYSPYRYTSCYSLPEQAVTKSTQIDII